MLYQEQRQSLSQRIDPKIILANSILQLSAPELAQSVERELLDNPALDTVEDLGCAGDCIDPFACAYCSARRARELGAAHEAETPDYGDREPDYEPVFKSLPPSTDDDYDPVGNIEAEVTLQEHLLTLLRAAVSSEDYPIGEYVVNSLNDRGWLGTSVESLAAEMGVPEARVCSILSVIQSLDPPGVGARDLRECLLLQLRYLKEEDLPPEDARMNAIAEAMIMSQFEHVCAKRFTKLARTAKISVDEAREALEYIRRRLNPCPASQFRPPWKTDSADTQAEIRPDIIIRRSEVAYEIEVTGADPAALCVSPGYRDMHPQGSKGVEGTCLEERRRVAECVERAELFIHNIGRRRQTLRRITRCVVERQAGFLETGSRQFLRPLTRTAVAEMLNIHESIVSRATANKFVQLPNQEVVSFDVFFNASLSVKDAIDAILREEDPAHPLSDKLIAERLQEQGITVARRTVVKYREAQKILSSSHRKR